jgi:hypothetical protein
MKTGIKSVTLSERHLSSPENSEKAALIEIQKHFLY